MQHVVLGAGAFGSLMAAYLTLGGIETVLVDTDHARLADIERNGLRITGFRGDATIRVPALPGANLKTLAPLDVVMLCVKPAQSEDALRSVLPFCNADTLFVPFLGGLANFRVAEMAGAERVVPGVANLECMLRLDGAVETDFHNFIWLGEFDRTYTQRLQDLQLTMSWLGPTFVTQVITGMIWSKTLYSLEVALSTLVDTPPLEVFSRPPNRQLAAALVYELLDLVTAVGGEAIAFDFFDPNLYVAKNAGQSKVTDIWIHHAWLRHEQFRVGFEYEFPAKAGLSWSLSPLNPREETTDLVRDLLERGEKLGVPLPLTRHLAALFAEARAGKRRLGQENLDEIERARRAEGIPMPGLQE